MRSNRTLVIWWIALVPTRILFPQAALEEGRSEASPYLPLDHWSYVYIGLLQDRSHLKPLHPSIRPYRRMQIARAIAREDTATAGRPERQWLALLMAEFKAELDAVAAQHSDTEYGRTSLELRTQWNQTGSHSDIYPSVYPEVSWRSGNMVISGRGRIDRKLLDDSTYSGRKTDLFAARMEDGYGVFSGGRWSLMIGRLSRSWSPFPNESLVLSANPYSYDHLAFSYQSRHFSFQSVFAELDDYQTASRYLSAHRLDVRFSSGVAVGFAESVVYGGSGERIRLGYLNPFTIMANAQLNDHLEANQTFSADVYLPFRSFVLRGQVLIDDLILDGADQPMPNRKTSPDRLAYVLGLTVNDLLFPQTQTVLSYRRIGSYTYNVKQKRPWQGYTYQGRGLGSETNDMDECSLRVTYLSSLPVLVFVDLSLQRLGERRLNSHDFEDSTFVKLPFPSGIVKKTAGLSISALYRPSIHTAVSAMIGIRRITNEFHSKGRDRTSMVAQLSATWQFAGTRTFQ